MALYDEREAPLLDDPVGGVLLGYVDLPDAAQTLPSYLGSIAPSVVVVVVVVAWNAVVVVVVVVVAWNAATAADDDVLGADQTTHAANYT